MKRILVPVDFSAESENALKTAVVIARKTGAELNILHIIELGNFHSFTVSASQIPEDHMENLFMIKLIESSKERIRAIEQRADLSDIKVNTHLKVGNVFSHISETITSFNIDLIVMGTTGVDSLEDLFVGSNTEKVLRTSRCPVLTVKKFTEDLVFKNLVLATDLHYIAPEFISFIYQLQKFFDFKIHILYVNTPANFKSTEQVKELMQEITAKYTMENFTVNVFNAFEEEEGIRSFAKEVKADMIALTTHGRKGLSNMMWGSVSEDIVNQSSLPILVYRNHVKKSKKQAYQETIKV